MKRFSLSEKFKRKAAAKAPLEIERPSKQEEPLLRKWFLRGILLLMVAALAYFVLKDVFFVEVRGLIRPEKITVESPSDGIFIPLASVGDVVEPNKPVAKIYNPQLEAEIKALTKSLRLLELWREKLKEENAARKELEELRQKVDKAFRLYTVPDPKALREELDSLYQQRKYLLEDLVDKERKLKRLKELVTVGAATESELLTLKSTIDKIRSSISALNSKIARLKDELRRAEQLKRLAKEIKEVVGFNPLYPNLASIDRDIDTIRSRLKVLESKLSVEFISFPFRVKVSSALPSGSYVVKGTNVLSVLNVEKYFVIAYVPPKLVSKLYRGEFVKILLPNGDKLKGKIVNFEPSLVLKPPVLVGPLEKRELVLPVKIQILGDEREVRELVYEDMPVVVVFGK
jgi:hypothetical protein